MDGIGELMLDAKENCAKPITTKSCMACTERLLPSGDNNTDTVAVEEWRHNSIYRIQVVRGPSVDITAPLGWLTNGMLDIGQLNRSVAT